MTMTPLLRRIVALAGIAGTLSVSGGSLLAQQVPDRSRAPVPGPPPSLRLPAVQKRALANGLPVWIVEQHKVPVAQVNLVVFSGSAQDPAGKFGIANFTVAMLENGAGTRSALEIADAIDYLGADLASAGGIDSSTVRLHAPVARLSDALSIMADVALRPTFPDAELERLRRERLTSLLQARDNPQTMASAAFSRVLYGSAHRYGTPITGTAETIRSFRQQDLRAFYTGAFRPDNAALVVVGDVTPNTIMPVIESAFGKWQGQGQKAQPPALPSAASAAARQIYLVDKPGAPQSQVRVGAVGVARSTPDYFAIQVMNTILGGAFSSRLNLNLREKHGYTYGASSGFDMRATPGPFVAAAGVQTDKTSEALKEFFNELNGMHQPVPAEELSRAKNYVALSFPADFETTGEVARRLEELLVYHLPEDYYSKYVQNIAAVSGADVLRVAQQYVQPDKVAVVIVGDLKTIEPGIRALNLGAIKVMTVDEVFGPAPTVGD
jgi:predicted Zn-dependent peptidase